MRGAVEARVKHSTDALRRAFLAVLVVERNPDRQEALRLVESAADALAAPYMSLVVMIKAGYTANGLDHVKAAALARVAS